MNILIIAPSWIGDAIMSQTMYRILIKNNPKIKIDLITPYLDTILFQKMPEIKKIIPLTFVKHGSIPLKKYYQLGKSLQKSKKYQQAIILPNSFKSGLIPFFANIPKRTGWKGEMRYGIINDIRTLNIKNFPLMIQRYAALAFETTKVKTAKDLPNPLPWPYINCTSKESEITLKKFNIIINNHREKKVIGICPGAEFGSIKRWPDYHYANLIKQLTHQKYQIILLGSHKEKMIGYNIQKNLPEQLQKYCYNLIGLTTLNEAILIIKICNAIISNDSGLMHIASALHKPIIALYGASDPNCTPPLYKHRKIIQFHTKPLHTICKKTIRKINHTEEYHPNLINIHPEIVLKKLKELLQTLL